LGDPLENRTSIEDRRAAPTWLLRRFAPSGRAESPAHAAIDDEHEAALRQVEIEGKRLELTVRRVALFWLCVFLAIAVILIGITVYCYLDGSHKTIPRVTGPAGVTSAIMSYLLGRRATDLGD
jgi:hypothetical protein